MNNTPEIKHSVFTLCEQGTFFEFHPKTVKEIVEGLIKYEAVEIKTESRRFVICILSEEDWVTVCAYYNIEDPYRFDYNGSWVYGPYMGIAYRPQNPPGILG